VVHLFFTSSSSLCVSLSLSRALSLVASFIPPKKTKKTTKINRLKKVLCNVGETHHFVVLVCLCKNSNSPKTEALYLGCQNKHPKSTGRRVFSTVALWTKKTSKMSRQNKNVLDFVCIAPLNKKQFFFWHHTHARSNERKLLNIFCIDECDPFHGIKLEISFFCCSIGSFQSLRFGVCGE